MFKVMRKRHWVVWLCVATFLLGGCGLYSGKTREEATFPSPVQDGDKAEGQIPADELTAGVEPAQDGNSGEDETPKDESEAAGESLASEEDVPLVKEPPSISLLMVGDVLLHTPVEESSRRADGSYDYSALFEHTKERIEAADLSLVNQEVIIGGEELGITGYPSFNASFRLCDALVDTGFDVICHATNHALDKGKKGVVSCSEHWEENFPEIAVLGIHAGEETSSAYGAAPYLYGIEGENGDTLTLAVLNYTYGTNGIALPKDMPYAVDLLEEKRVVEDIRQAEELADFTVVCPHWGTEYRLTPDAYQEKWTRIFLENGVDLVLGTHPHVIEPIEWVEDAESGQRMLVYYSLGNFVNWTSGTGEGVANRMVGGMAKLEISKNEEGEAYIRDYGVEALVTHVQPGEDGVSTYLLKEYSRELAGQNAICLQDPAFSYDYCEDLCDKVWGELWRE